MDLVAGATGQVGGRAALGLRARGRDVRALVRGGSARAEAEPLAAAGIEIADADLARPETLAAACAGVDTVVCTVTTMPHGRDDGLRRVDRDGVRALIDAAERGGARRFVYVSYSGNLTTESPLGEAKRACEHRLRSGRMEFAILRPSFFMEVWLGPAAGFDPRAGRARIFGSGDAPVSYVAARDVASFATALATHPDPVRETLEIGGPEPLTRNEAARRAESALGLKLEREVVPLAALEEQHRTATDPVPRTFAALALACARGDEIPDARATAARWGMELRSFVAYLRDFAG
jgi:NADH dehydrogenase